MIPLIQQALIAGYTASQILTFIGKKITGMSTGIQNAKTRGYSDEDILKFLQGKIKTKNPKELEKGATDLENYYSKIGLKTKEERQQDKARFIKGTLGVAGTALGAYKLYQNYAGQFGNTLQGFGQVTPIPTGQQMLQDQSMSPQGLTPPPTSIPPPTVGQPPEQDVIDKLEAGGAIAPSASIPAVDILDQLGIRSNVDTMIQAGNAPDQVAQGLRFMLKPKAVQDIEKKTGKSLQEIVADYQATKPQQKPPLEDQGQTAGLQPVQPIEPTDVGKVRPQEVTTGSTVLTPEGIGKIEHMPGKSAKVDINGKKKVFDSDKLIQMPAPEEDLANLYDDLIKGISEKSGKVSTNVYWAGYDPNTNELAYVPHDGALYVYKDVSEEDKKALTDMLTKRKSTGENYIGAWTVGTESPIGAAMSALIKKMQTERGGKGKEYSGKFQKIYDAFEPAKVASKKRFEAKKKAEKPQKAKKPIEDKKIVAMQKIKDEYDAKIKKATDEKLKAKLIKLRDDIVAKLEAYKKSIKPSKVIKKTTVKKV